MSNHHPVAFEAAARDAGFRGFDGTARELALSVGAALFVIAFVAPGLSELLGLSHEGASMSGARHGMFARPLIEAVMQLPRGLRDDARGPLRTWISRRWN